MANYCPLIWMGATGANITPDKLPTEQRAAVTQYVWNTCFPSSPS